MTLMLPSKPVIIPEDATLVKCLTLSNFKFVDNIKTPNVETVQGCGTAAFKKAIPVVSKADGQTELNWGKYKDAGIRHLLRLAPLSRIHLETGKGRKHHQCHQTISWAQLAYDR